MNLSAPIRSDYLMPAIISGFVGLLIFANGSGWIRNYGGDIVAIVFLYCLMGIILPTLTPKQKTFSVLFIAVAIEIIQSLNLFDPGVSRDLILGATFDPIDLIFYAVTAAVCYKIDKKEGA